MEASIWKPGLSDAVTNFKSIEKELYEVFDDYQDPGIKQYNDCLEVVQESKFVYNVW